jgi:hypothetical protein
VGPTCQSRGREGAAAWKAQLQGEGVFEQGARGAWANLVGGDGGGLKGRACRGSGLVQLGQILGKVSNWI